MCQEGGAGGGRAVGGEATQCQACVIPGHSLHRELSENNSTVGSP